MPSERAEEPSPWIDEIDGPERLERSKKKRAEQLKRWEKREIADPVGKRVRRNNKLLKFVPNVVVLEAAARNDLNEVSQLLESGVNPDLANEDGLTALHQSCIDGCDDMVKYLVEHNANVNACDKELWTPLHAAAACGHMTILKYLLANGGNILALNVDGNFPVDVVEETGKVEKYLEQEMAKIGYNEEGIEELRQNQGKQLLDDLKDSLEKERSLDIQDENGATAFHFAAANGWTNVVDFLLENEADFEIADHDGWQPIHAAAAWGHDTVLEVLVASGADLDSRTNDSQTPLDLTEEDEIIELIEELKTKQVKYPRKGKGVRRRRSNTSNSSIKRSSIIEKNELSHADAKAEGAALLIQLQNDEESEVSTPDEPQTSPQQILDSHFGERTSLGSRDETSSSGYVSEASTETKTEEKLESNEQQETSQSTSDDVNPKLDVSNYITDNESESAGNNVEKPSNNPTNINTSPVPKPPRLATSKEPSSYINVDIEHTRESPRAGMPTAKQPAAKENLKPSTPTNKNELNKQAAAKVEEGRLDNTSVSSKSTPNEKRRAPEPPGSSRSTTTPENVPQKKSSTKKANRSSNRSSESSTKKSCTIL